MVVTGGDDKGLRYINGYYKNPHTPGDDIHFSSAVLPDWNDDVIAAINKANLPWSAHSDSNLLASAVMGFLPIALFLLVLYFFFRQQIRMAGKGALNFV